MDTWNRVKDFYDYVKDDEESLEKDMIDRGLKNDAPESALKAYEEYIKQEKLIKCSPKKK
jgi:hypothetical protein